MVLCIGTFAWGKPCRYNAKFGQFCGRHCQKEGVIYCKQVLKSGKSCSYAAVENGFCNLHKNPCDNKQHKLYLPDVGWPYMHEVLRDVKPVYCLKDLDWSIKTVISKYSEEQEYINFFVGYGYSRDENKCTMIITELFFRNYQFNYNTEYWQNIIVSYVNKIKEIPFLKEYCELFRRKFDQQYRLDAQKKYVFKMLALNKVFGKDIARNIVSFL
jgi:hypothetical protein